jgi:hypothetical protein
MPRSSLTEANPLRSPHSTSPPRRTPACAGPCRSSDDVDITTSAPASRYAATSAALSTPVDPASEHATFPRSRLIHDRGSVPSAGCDSRNPVDTVNVSGSMSVCMNLLNSTRPAAPAWSSRTAISPNELKNGATFTATGTPATALTVVRTSM